MIDRYRSAGTNSSVCGDNAITDFKSCVRINDVCQLFECFLRLIFQLNDDLILMKTILGIFDGNLIWFFQENYFLCWLKFPPNFHLTLDQPQITKKKLCQKILKIAWRLLDLFSNFFLQFSPIFNFIIFNFLRCTSKFGAQILFFWEFSMTHQFLWTDNQKWAFHLGDERSILHSNYIKWWLLKVILEIQFLSKFFFSTRFTSINILFKIN